MFHERVESSGRETEETAMKTEQKMSSQTKFGLMPKMFLEGIHNVRVTATGSVKCNDC
jgi:hypothetical protein